MDTNTSCCFQGLLCSVWWELLSDIEDGSRPQLCGDHNLKIIKSLINPFTPRVNRPWVNKCGCNFCTFMWCCLCLTILQNETQDFFLSFELSTLGSERVNTKAKTFFLRRWLNDFPHLPPFTCFPALATSYMLSRTYHQFVTCPHMPPGTHFPALGTGYMFSHVCHRLQKKKQ